MSGPVLGIDLGTTNSAVAVADGRESRVLADADGRRLIPSVVSFHPDGSILVGHDARERRLVDARNTVYSIKRLIGRPFQSSEVQRAKERVAFALEATAVGGVQVRVRRGTFALPEISAMVLRHLRSIAESALGEPCQRAVITVPANFNELQRSATQAAGKVAGLEVMRIINEPTAATLAYGYAREKAETIAVYDLGGGTFDLTVLDLDKDVFEVVSTAGDTFLGGDDIDVLVADRMALQCLKEHRYDPKQDSQTFERLRAAAEWAKCQLSAVHEVEVTIEELLHDANGRAVNFQFRMARTELEELARPLIARSFDVVNDALRSAGRRPKEIKSVVLVGGSTRMPMVRRMVTEFFHREPQADIDPDLVVAQGAAIHAFTLSGEKRASNRPRVPPSKAIARVALRKVSQDKMPPARPPPEPRRQPAFAPEDPRDLAPRIEDSVRLAQVPLKRMDDDRPARRVGSNSDVPPIARSNTSPYGMEKPAPEALVAAPAAQGSHPGVEIDFDLEDSATTVGAFPTKEAPKLDLSPPFVEPVSSVAVIRTQAVGVGAPKTAQRVRPEDSPRATAEPREEIAPETPLRRPPRVREPTMQITAGQKPRPFAAAPSGPTVPELTDDLPQRKRVPDARPATVALEPGDLSPASQPPPAAERAAPPPMPPARPPDREKIQSALFGGKPKPFAEAMPLPEVAPSAAVAAPSRAQDPGYGAGAPAWGHATGPTVAMPIAPAAAPPWSNPASSPGWAEPPSASIPLVGLPEPAPQPPISAGFGFPLGQPQISPQALSPRQPVVAMPDRAAPLLMDVTPLALGLETAGGYVQHLVNRNAPIPTEKTRVFSTARDDQTEVEVRICQGDSNVFKDNQALGAITLTALRRARRGEIRIEVTFMIDASGILDVKATDLDTKHVQALRIALRGGIEQSEVDAMRQRQERDLFPAQR